jgi:hypothetical protein
MAFNYGKNTLEIKNPFKTEGLLDLILGGITLIFGITLVFKIRLSINSGLPILAWSELILSIVFITFSIRSIIIGISRLLRFLIGRDVPSNISPNPYSQETIEKVLMNRTNPTFVEKNDFLSRLLISIFNKFLFLPINFRNLMESVSSILISFLIFFTLYLLTVFSASIGLINLTDKKAIISLFSIFFLFKQLLVWFNYRPNNKRIISWGSKSYSYKNIAYNIIMAILAPTIFELMLRNGLSLPTIEINIFVPILLLLIFSAGLFFITYFLCLKRVEILNPETEVSEYKEHIQVTVHPKDVFRCFEMEMSNKRYKELPNRIYKTIKPILELEGSQNKGSFHGSTIQETQPIYKLDNTPESAKKMRFYTALGSRILMLFSFIYLFFSIEMLKNEININLIFKIFYYPSLIIFFAYYLNKIAHLFYSEILFSSNLVHFFSDGTYAESKVSSGMSVYDSNRSENTIVNTSATPWILVSKIITSTFSDSSTRNLEGNRFILEMYKDDVFLNDLVSGFTNYLSNRKLIVGFNAKDDLKTSLDFNKLNEITRANNNTKKNIEEHVEKKELDNL